MKALFATLLGVLCISLAVVDTAGAQDRVVVAGQDGIAAPKRTKTINPSYPQEALAQGIRGIVILEILIDTQGRVASAEVIRSLPLLDEAALVAVRKWEYEITKVDGQPVSVKLTVPITFALKLPEVTRAPGIPELRQGASVGFPAGQTEGSSVTAQITLAPDGQVAEADVVQGQAPWTVALVQALRTWRFAPEGENVILTFQVEAVFVPPARGDKARVDVRLSNLRRSESMGTPAPAPTATTAGPEAGSSPTEPLPETAQTRAAPAPDIPLPPAEPGPPSLSSPGAAAPPASPAPGAPAVPDQVPPKAAPATEPAPTSVAPRPATTTPAPGAATPVPAGPTAPPTGAPVQAPPTSPAPRPAAPAPAVAPPATAGPAPAGGAAGPPSPAPARPGTPAVEARPTTVPPTVRPSTPAPPVEVVTAPLPPGASAPSAAPVVPGVSAVKDVTLALGVPDLVRGRRPVPPPFARMSGTTGAVEVKFGVDAAGATSVSEVSGPDPLKLAAAYTVQSWSFRRITAERLHLVASFDFAGETAKVSVKPE